MGIILRRTLAEGLLDRAMAEERNDPMQGAFWPELVAPATRGAAPAVPRPARLCKQCGGLIPAPAGRRTYCSPACRERAQPPKRAPREAAGGAARRFADRPGVSGPIPGPLALDPPAPRAAAPELTPHRRLVLAWQLLSAYRPAALWQALTPEEQAQAAAITTALYQWARDLEPFARRHRGS